MQLYYFISLAGVATPLKILNGNRGQVSYHFKCLLILFTTIYFFFNFGKYFLRNCTQKFQVQEKNFSFKDKIQSKFIYLIIILMFKMFSIICQTIIQTIFKFQTNIFKGTCWNSSTFLYNSLTQIVQIFWLCFIHNRF